jgi:uncharacterized protein YbcI
MTTSAFFSRAGQDLHLQDLQEPIMEHAKFTIAQQVATVARDFQHKNTGWAPTNVTVVLSEGTLVITLHEALSPAERSLAKTPAGAAQVQEFHRQLFKASMGALRKEIKRITGLSVREAAAEIEPVTGDVVHAFTSGTMVQVFLLDDIALRGAFSTRSIDSAKPDAQPQPT